MKKFVLNGKIMCGIVYKTGNVVIQRIQAGKNGKNAILLVADSH